MSEHAHIVIGGGISGLSAAHYALKAGVDTCLLEASERAGGCIHTSRFDTLDGFWVEAGGHTCFNSYGNLLGIMEDLNLLRLTTEKAKRSYKLWVGGQRRGILKALHPFDLATSLPRLFTAKKAGKSVRGYYARVLGQRNYRDLFGPAFRSVVCQDADDFPAEALFRKKPRRKDVLRAFTMPGGLSDIPEAIAAEAGLDLRLGARVRSIATDAGRLEVRLEDGATLSCEHLTLAVPPDVAAPLLEAVAPAASAAVSGIGIAEIDTSILVFDRSRLEVEELAGLISVDAPFLSAVSRDFLADDRYRGFAFHFPGGRYSTDERLAAACSAIDASPADAVAVEHVANRLPALRAGHAQHIQALDAALVGTRIGVTGNWFLGVSIEDCVSRTRAEHERLFGATQSS